MIPTRFQTITFSTVLMSDFTKTNPHKSLKKGWSPKKENEVIVKQDLI